MFLHAPVDENKLKFGAEMSKENRNLDRKKNEDEMGGTRRKAA